MSRARTFTLSRSPDRLEIRFTADGPMTEALQRIVPERLRAWEEGSATWTVLAPDATARPWLIGYAERLFEVALARGFDVVTEVAAARDGGTRAVDRRTGVAIVQKSLFGRARP